MTEYYVRVKFQNEKQWHNTMRSTTPLTLELAKQKADYLNKNYGPKFVYILRRLEKDIRRYKNGMS